MPEQDAMTVKELPFQRFPSAGLIRVGGARNKHPPRVGNQVSRAGMTDVLEHYLRVIRQTGWPIDYNSSRPGTLWWGSYERPIKGIAGITVMPAAHPFVFGKTLSLEQVRERAPTLFSDFPESMTGFQVNVGCEGAAHALPYQSEEAAQ